MTTGAGPFSRFPPTKKRFAVDAFEDVYEFHIAARHAKRAASELVA
jgi:hypothetical protein